MRMVFLWKSIPKCPHPHISDKRIQLLMVWHVRRFVPGQMQPKVQHGSNTMTRDANSREISFLSLHQPIQGLNRNTILNEYLPIMMHSQSHGLNIEASSNLQSSTLTAKLLSMGANRYLAKSFHSPAENRRTHLQDRLVERQPTYDDQKHCLWP